MDGLFMFIPCYSPKICQRYENLLLVGGFNPSEKYESVVIMTFPIYGKS